MDNVKLKNQTEIDPVMKLDVNKHEYITCNRDEIAFHCIQYHGKFFEYLNATHKFLPMHNIIRISIGFHNDITPTRREK